MPGVVKTDSTDAGTITELRPSMGDVIGADALLLYADEDRTLRCRLRVHSETSLLKPLPVKVPPESIQRARIELDPSHLARLGAVENVGAGTVVDESVEVDMSPVEAKCFSPTAANGKRQPPQCGKPIPRRSVEKLSDLGYGPGGAPFTIIATDTKDPYGHIPVEQSILDGVGQSFGQCPYCIESRSGLQSVVDLQSGGPRLHRCP